MSSIAATPPAERVSRGRLLRAAALSVVAAAVATALAFLIISGVLGVRIALPEMMGGSLTVLPVIVSTVVGTAAGALVFAALVRFTKRPIWLYRIIAGVVLLLSFSNPFLSPGIDATSALWLCLLHIVAAVVSVVVLTTQAREQ